MHAYILIFWEYSCFRAPFDILPCIGFWFIFYFLVFPWSSTLSNVVTRYLVNYQWGDMMFRRIRFRITQLDSDTGNWWFRVFFKKMTTFPPVIFFPYLFLTKSKPFTRLSVFRLLSGVEIVSSSVSKLFW